MEKYIANSISFIKQNYPEVHITEKSNSVEFEGRFVFEAKTERIEIHEAPLLKIVMNYGYPSVQPCCFDVDRCITYDHINKNGALCLSTEIDIAVKLKKSTCISDYINELIIPFFLSFRYWEKYGYDLFGDYSHGDKGIYESIRIYLNNPYISEIDCYYMLLWASKQKKFRKAIPKEKQLYFLKNYLLMMKKLRVLGIPLLRRQLRML